MIIKIAILLLFAVILGSLGSALFYLIRDQGDSKRTARALTVRIAVSIAAFLLLLLGYWTGLIEPHGVLPPPR
ncbi:MAG TPA: twin transmembrane helix small protein [Thioalkalivibrio sp.]|nr:twin transmembrane helix small protein [Thioalkalivibrio sp.]